ncbi:winged helix-turn-helix domain-containing protein [Pseudohongiella sp.]|uniref:Winged helix-turn-helix domain-containing protein n=1 Tax=marine sediment metagenome TaxID=412755 RepID=A0A0F9YAI7_9ZZZZ|nr:crosslink repair DNA glycosylase YcaQ family protein [Pseudohongiella sp.]HDZ07964.1 winged helix-turn-helix domain-containing protein [Pseudohongiella sp.]HEA64429.1 winged helix-turn-helix domain-containing protein [Pseudohongiella sp.]
MVEVKHPRDRARLRRMALIAQGLLQSQPFGRGLAGARNAIDHLGYVQIDTISVVERAHHHVLFSRVPGFKPAMINQLMRSRDIFEYWSHAAAFLPMADFRFSLPYKHAIKSGKTHWFRHRDDKLMRELLARIRSDGPLRSRDIDAGDRKQAGWWDWKPAKKALEQLYMQGDLMVSDREGFQKSYDLTERVLPAGVDTQMPTLEEFSAHLMEQQLRCHGLVSLKGLTYLRRNAELRSAVKNLVDERLTQGQLQQVGVSNGDVFVLPAGALDKRLPRVPDRLLILSPFDNSVIQRDRLKALFDYDYQIECYVPAAKRQYGYFCLPLLYRDEFIGRMDCKAHRKTGELEIKSLYLESYGFDEETVIAALVDAVQEFCRFQQCDSVSLTAAHPWQLAAPLRKALAAAGS